MKFIFNICCFSALFTLPFFSSQKDLAATTVTTDSIPSSHKTDGWITEWPANTFHADSDSTILTAIDNDDLNLYVALTIRDFSMQTKLIRSGMKLFIDLKEKKKQGRGVEFPVSDEVNSFMKASSQDITSNSSSPAKEKDKSKKEFDQKKARNIMSLGMVSLKIFGLPTDDDEQGLTVPGSINIAFKWDAAGEMHIEYSIPLKLLDIAATAKTPMDIGWLVNGTERWQRTGQTVDYSDGQGMGFNNAPGRPQRISGAEMMKEQKYWTKYIIVAAKDRKAF